MSFHEVQFPTEISYGSRGGPGFNTNVLVLDSGAEERVARWSSPRRRYDVRYGIRSRADLQAVLEFYIRRLGPAHGFRYKDWLDFTSASDGMAAPTYLDQLLGSGDGSEVDFQLVKTYTDGIVSRERTITKPVSGTVVVAIDGVEQLSGWTVSTVTGIVTFSSPPAANKDVTAGFEFDVPVRFGKEADDVLEASIDSYDIGDIGSIPLIEVKEGLSDSGEFWYGGSQELSLDTTYTITINDGRAISVTPTGAGKTLKLQDGDELSGGGPYWMLYNAGSDAFDVDDYDDNPVGTISPGIAVELYLVKNATGTSKVWVMI